MERKLLIAAITISVLLFLAVGGTELVNLGRANPYTNSQYSGETGAPPSAKSPVVSIFSPENNKMYSTNSVTLAFNATVEEFSEGGYTSPLITGMRIDESHYTADWLQNSTQIELATYLDPEESYNSVSVSMNLTGIPDGNHVIRIYVSAKGTIVDPFHWYTFKRAGYSRVNFTIDTSSPRVSVFPIINKTYAESELREIPLTFTVNESTSKISYVLDGRDDVTIDGNTTLSGLSYGVHNVTVFAWDNTGNVGSSEIIWFSVAEAFPTVTVAAASVATIAFTGTGLLVYFKKRKR